MLRRAVCVARACRCERREVAQLRLILSLNEERWEEEGRAWHGTANGRLRWSCAAQLAMRTHSPQDAPIMQADQE